METHYTLDQVGTAVFRLVLRKVMIKGGVITGRFVLLPSELPGHTFVLC